MDFEEVTAVVFDLDGTLCRYAMSIEKAITEALKRGGCSCELLGDCAEAAARYKQLWHQEALIHDVNWPLRERLWRRLLEENGTNDVALARALAEHYTQIRIPEICLFSGVHELLVDLKQCYRLGLLTNGPTDMQWQKIDSLGIAPLFDVVVVSGDEGVHKPDRHIFDVLLARLGTSPRETLYVGDSHAMDIVGAKRAEMCSVWVNRENERNTQEIRPDAEITEITELRELLL